MRTIVQIIVAVLALTVLAPGYAEESAQQGFYENRGNVGKLYKEVYSATSDRINYLAQLLMNPIIKIDRKEFDCLARNIFFEAANEPEEGKVAVALVTLNRKQDGRFRNTVCGVVDQRLTENIPKQITVTRQVKTGWFGRTEEQSETQTVWKKLTICQFSWRCMFVKNPKSTDERWVESQIIAHEILANSESYTDYREKYNDALYFHSTSVRPTWAHRMKPIERIGGHIFYAERN